jgi:hypothetical protein
MMKRLKLRMVLVGRVSSVIAIWVGAILVLGLLDSVNSNENYQTVAALALLLLAILVTVRLVRFGVDATADTVTVRGYRWPKPIPIRSITQVKRGPMPVISWTDEHGNHRFTYIPGLRSDIKINWSNRRAQQATEQLVDWIEGHRALTA